jgi:amidase
MTRIHTSYEDHDAVGLAGLVRAGEVTPGELLDAALARIERHDPALNAIVHRFEQLGRDLIAAGLPDGPFTGVPLLLKDTGTALGGTPLTGGSRLLAGVVSPRDGTLAMRLKAAGFVPIGKTNVPEFALSFTTEPEAFGATRNPWDVTRTPGGSSGGAAAAVAVGMVPLAHCSDGAGSIRVPAAHCGLFGFKPSRIRNPLGPDVSEGIAGMSTPHALSRSVRDSAAMLDATSGPDIGDPYAVPPPTRPFAAELAHDPAGLRIGMLTLAPLGTPIAADCLAATADAAKLCAELGHEVEHAVFEHDAAALKQAWRVIAGVGAAQQVTLRQAGLGIADPLALVEPVNAAWVEEGRGWSGRDYMAAVNQLHRTARALGRFFTRYDILLSPTTAEVAPILGHLAGGTRSLDEFYDRFWNHAPFTAAFNAGACPAMSVPLHWTAAGLPVGVHFGAGFGREGVLFALAGQLERARPWFHKRPGMTA